MDGSGDKRERELVSPRLRISRVVVGVVTSLVLCSVLQFVPHGRAMPSGGHFHVFKTDPKTKPDIKLGVTVYSRRLGWPLRSGSVVYGEWVKTENGVAVPFEGEDAEEYMASQSHALPPGVRTRAWDTSDTVLNFLICLVIGVGSPMGLFYLRNRRIRRLILENRCLGCGYHLEGLTERRCPECGRAF